MKRWIAAIATCALAVFVWVPGSAAPISSLRIVTPAYTLECLPHMQGKTLELACVPAKTPARVADALERWRYGDPAPRGIFAQTELNGGPVLCADTTLVCTTGAVGINPAGAPTVANLTDSGLTAGDLCVAANGSNLLIDGACLTTAGGQTVTASETFTGGFTDNGTTTISGNTTFQTGALSITNGAAMSAAPLTFATGTYTSASLANVQGDAAGDLVFNSATSQTVKVNNKLSAQLGIGLNVTSLSGLGHEGFNTATALAAGGGTCANNSCDALGTVPLSSGTATVTFHTAYSAAPVCVATDQTAAAAVKAVATTTSVVFTGTTSDVIGYRCAANGGA